jgi:hypothetical protein
MDGRAAMMKWPAVQAESGTFYLSRMCMRTDVLSIADMGQGGRTSQMADTLRNL